MHNTGQSEELYRRAARVIPRGTHSDSRVREPHPFYFTHAKGAWVTDADGNRFLDCLMGNGAVILGHAHPGVNRAAVTQLERGLGAGLESELSIRVAEQFLGQVRTAQKMRFANTGTEAILHAIAIARAHTGKPDLAKPEGSYHGWCDFLFVSAFPGLTLAGAPGSPASLPGTPGLHPAAVSSTLILPFNDLENTERLLRENAHRLAAVVLEPVLVDIGWVPAEGEYLKLLRQLTTELGIVLIFDELLTGFRLARGGAQEFYGVTPDLSVFGKALGNGYIISAVAGRSDLLDPDPGDPAHAMFMGTFNSHQVSLAASSAVLDALEDGSIVRRLGQLTESLTSEFSAMARRTGVAAQMRGGGGHFHWYFTEREVTNYRSAAASDARAYAVFQQKLWETGILSARNHLQHHCVSSAHGDEEIALLLRGMRAGLEAVRRRSPTRIHK